MDKVKEGIESTGIPTDLPSGSFGISPEGAQQALTNRLGDNLDQITGTPLNLPEGSFGISEAGAREALTNRIESQTGIPANLPEGAFTVTPKKKFNIPKITNERTEEFDRRAQVLRNQRDFGGTGEPINFDGRIVNPGDDDYIEVYNIINNLMRGGQ